MSSRGKQTRERERTSNSCVWNFKARNIEKKELYTAPRCDRKKLKLESIWGKKVEIGATRVARRGISSIIDILDKLRNHHLFVYSKEHSC